MADPKDVPTRFFVCRVVYTKEKRLDYVVVQGDEPEGREDIEVASVGLASEEEAEAAIRQLGGTIPGGLYPYLDNFPGERDETVWCWKDERTHGATETFESEEEAMEAWRNDELIFEPPPC